MPVAGIGVERHIRDQADFGRSILHRLQGARHEPVRVQRAGAGLVLAVCANIGKQRDGRNAKLSRANGGLGGVLDAQPINAGQGADGHAIFAIMDEDGPDQISGRQHVFASERTDPWGLAQAAHAGGGEGLGELGHVSLIGPKSGWLQPANFTHHETAFGNVEFFGLDTFQFQHPLGHITASDLAKAMLGVERRVPGQVAESGQRNAAQLATLRFVDHTGQQSRANAALALIRMDADLVKIEHAAAQGDQRESYRRAGVQPRGEQVAILCSAGKDVDGYMVFQGFCGQ